MHKVVAATTQRCKILERFFCEAVVCVMVEVVDGEPPPASAHFTHGLSAGAKTIFLHPAASHGTPRSRRHVCGIPCPVLVALC